MKYDEILGCKFIQNNKSQKITYDSVFLAYFVKPIKKGMKIMELGSGNGVVSILLKRFNQKVDFQSEGIEIQKDLYEISLQNASLNLMNIKFYNIDIKNIESKFYGIYDIVFANPPYMKVNNGKFSPYKERDISRREINGTINNFVKAASLLLKNGAKFYMIWRTERLQEAMSVFDKHNLKVKILRPIYASELKESYATLIMAIKNAKYGLTMQHPLYIRNNMGELTGEVKKIYSL